MWWTSRKRLGRYFESIRLSGNYWSVTWSFVLFMEGKFIYVSVLQRVYRSLNEETTFPLPWGNIIVLNRSMRKGTRNHKSGGRWKFDLILQPPQGQALSGETFADVVQSHGKMTACASFPISSLSDCFLNHVIHTHADNNFVRIIWKLSLKMDINVQLFSNGKCPDGTFGLGFAFDLLLLLWSMVRLVDIRTFRRTDGCTMSKKINPKHSTIQVVGWAVVSRQNHKWWLSCGTVPLEHSYHKVYRNCCSWPNVPPLPQKSL